MRFADTKYGYGWISIALHWSTALAILALWFIGNTIQAVPPDKYRSIVDLHTSLAACAYVFLWARIIWRLAHGHPGTLPIQGRVFFKIGKCVHYCILLALILMLISGPLMVWARGGGLRVFDWFVILDSAPVRPRTAYFAHTAHVWGGMAIILGTLLHIAGVFKHAAFDRDGTFDRMMIAARRTENAE